MVLDAVFDKEIDHELLGKVAAGTISVEYYWLDRWYNVFRFSDRTGTFQSFYCNVSMPPSFDGHVLEYAQREACAPGIRIPTCQSFLAGDTDPR